MDEPGAPRSFLILLTGTVAFEGLRAGAGTFRMLIDLPARHAIGPAAFAAFSRATDLSPAGIAFYVAYGFGGMLLTATSLVLAWRLGLPTAVRTLTAVAAACSLLVLILTIQAAPLMWEIADESQDVALSSLIERFVVLTNLRIVLVDVSFAAVLLAMALLVRERRRQA